MTSLEGAVKELTGVVNKLATRDAADLVRIGNLEARTAALEEWKRWAVRLVLGAVILAGLALVFDSRA